MRAWQQRVGLNTKFRAAYEQFFIGLCFPSLHEFLDYFWTVLYGTVLYMQTAPEFHG